MLLFAFKFDGDFSQIETMKTLQHPNIVQFLDFYQDKKKAYLLLELYVLNVAAHFRTLNPPHLFFSAYSVDGGTVLDRILLNDFFSEKVCDLPRGLLNPAWMLCSLGCFLVIAGCGLCDRGRSECIALPAQHGCFSS